jgi:hypothetical protein
MFSKKKKTPAEKAEVLGRQLVGAIPEISSRLFDTVDESIKSDPDGVDVQFLIEVSVFYMHLLNRIAFKELQPSERDVFVHHLVDTVVDGIGQEQHESISSEDFRTRFIRTYNEREVHYAQFREWLRKSDQPPKGTLFWEFGEVLFALAGDDPKVGMCVYIGAPSIFTWFFDVMKVNETLRG